MKDRNFLRDQITGIIHSTYENLTAQGINLAARYPVYLQALSLTGRDKHKGIPGSLQPVGEPVELVVMDMKIGQVTQWREGANQVVGDAFIEVPQHEISRADLDGSALRKDYAIRYEIDGVYYTPINGGVQDQDGLTWRVTLKKMS